MIKTFEAIIDQEGRERLLETVKLTSSRRALVTILEEVSDTYVSETALLSESALSEDWEKPEEEAAWQHLQSVK
jgi:hypothetical protein